MQMLENGRLQKILLGIDSAEDRFEELEKQLQNDGNFSAFMKDLMVDLGYMNQDGSSKI